MVRLSLKRLVAALLLFCLASLTFAQEASAPVRLGVRVDETPQGPRVSGILAGSLAAGLGIQPGDLIVSVNNQSVATPGELARAMEGVQPGNILAIALDRHGRRLVVSAKATASGAPGLAGATRSRHLTDPASEALLARAAARSAYVASASPSRRLNEINVLREVYINRASGQLVFVGSYDPKYASGPIPYAVLVNEALATPAPAFSLEGSSGLGSAGFDRTAMARDLERFQRDPDAGVDWMKRVMDLFRNDPELASDRLRFARSLRDRLGVSEQDVRDYLAWDPRVTGPAPAGALKVVGASYTAAGLPQAGSAVVLLSRYSRGENTDENFLAIVSVLNIEGPLETFKDVLRSGGDEQAGNRVFMAALYQALFRAMRTPEPDIEAVLAPYRAGRTQEADLIAFFEARQVETIGPTLVNGMVLSQSLLKKLYALPPVRANLQTFGAPRASETMRIFFDADYLLKDVIFYGGMSEAFPGHQTLAPFLFAERRNAPAEARTDPGYEHARMWMQPQSVTMAVSPDNTVVRFADAGVHMRAEVMDYEGAGPSARAWFQSALDRYASRLSDNFDALASGYPAFHRLRETAKVLALVRWANQHGVRLAIAPTRYTPETLPPSVEGFWAATLLVSDGFESNAIGYSATGGVDFSQTLGGAWIQPQQAPQVASGALGQLAASAALADRAAAAAAGGDLESARALAEQSGRAMTGDLSDLGPGAQVPLPPGVDIQEAATVTREVLSAAEAGTGRLLAVQQDLAAAKQLRATDAATADRNESVALQNQAYVQESLLEVKDLLAQYRSSPAQGERVVKQLKNLSNAMSGPLPPQPTVAPSPAPGPLSQDAPGDIARTRAELAKELCDLRADLRRITDSQRRLSRSISQDVRELESWEREAAEAQSRARANLGSYLREVILGKYGQFLKGKGAVLPPARATETSKYLDRFGQALAAKDVDDWSQEDRKDLEWAGQALPMIAGVSDVDEGLKLWLTTGDVLIKTGYDLFAEGLAWEAIINMEARNEEYRRAIESAAGRSEKIVERIREVQAQLGGSTLEACP